MGILSYFWLLSFAKNPILCSWSKWSFQGRVISSTYSCGISCIQKHHCKCTWLYKYIWTLRSSVFIVCMLREILLLDILSLTGNAVTLLVCLKNCYVLLFLVGLVPFFGFFVHYGLHCLTLLVFLFWNICLPLWYIWKCLRFLNFFFIFCSNCTFKNLKFITSNVLYLLCKFPVGSAYLAGITTPASFGISNLVLISFLCFLLFPSHCQVNIIFVVQKEAFTCMLKYYNGRNPRKTYLSCRNTAKFSTASHQ